MKSPENRTNSIIINVVNAHGRTLSRGGRRITTEALEAGLNPVEVTMFVSRAAGERGNHKKTVHSEKLLEYLENWKNELQIKNGRVKNQEDNNYFFILISFIFNCNFLFPLPPLSRFRRQVDKLSNLRYSVHIILYSVDGERIFFPRAPEPISEEIRPLARK